MMMSDEERKARNEQAVMGIRQATARYIEQLRGEGLSEDEIEQAVREAQLEVARRAGSLLPGEEVPADFSSALVAFVRDVMKHGA